MKRLFGLGIAAVASLTLAGCSSFDNSVYDGTPFEGRDEQVKVAVIRNLGADEHTAQFLAGTTSEGSALHFDVDTYTTGGDNAKFEDVFNQVLLGNYDGIVVSHGQANAKSLIEKAVDDGIKVVTFDTEGDYSDLEGVTTTAQDDASLARLTLDAMVEEFDATVEDPVKVIKLWVSGFPPMERRNAVYQEYLQSGLIEEVASAAPVGDYTDVAGTTANAVGPLLTANPVGTVDAVWAAWDAFATGAYTAITEANRLDVKIYGIDVSNADLQLMQAANSPWVMTAAADAKLVGTLGIRLLAKHLADETVVSNYEVAATEIYQKDLSGTTTVETLSDVYSTWGNSTEFNEPWMDTLRKA